MSADLRFDAPGFNIVSTSRLFCEIKIHSCVSSRNDNITPVNYGSPAIKGIPINGIKKARVHSPAVWRSATVV